MLPLPEYGTKKSLDRSKAQPEKPLRMRGM